MHLLVDALADWINAAHFYRHGQGSEEPVQPPLELAIAMVSSGGSFLRWIADLDAKRSAA